MPNVVGSEFLQAKTELNNLHLDLDIQRADAYSPRRSRGTGDGELSCLR